MTDLFSWNPVEWRILKQVGCAGKSLDGKPLVENLFCVYSVKAFTIVRCNLTPEKVVEFFGEMGKAMAEEHAKGELAADGDRFRSPAMNFRYAYRQTVMGENHG